ncbi:MAG: hypothetical protein R2771_14340 [Saprospiraceae bacterium]
MKEYMEGGKYFIGISLEAVMQTAGASTPVTFAVTSVAPMVMDDLQMMIETGFDIEYLDQHGSKIWKYSQSVGDWIDKQVERAGNATIKWFADYSKDFNCFYWREECK